MKTLLNDEAGRFWTHVARGPASECWEWEGSLDGAGYGRFSVGGRTMQAHRVAYSLANDVDIPRDMVVVHICQARACCNPDHLALVSKSERSKVSLGWE